MTDLHKIIKYIREILEGITIEILNTQTVVLVTTTTKILDLIKITRSQIYIQTIKIITIIGIINNKRMQNQINLQAKVTYAISTGNTGKKLSLAQERIVR